MLLDTDHLSVLTTPDSSGYSTLRARLTANRQDFEKVPGLKIENWLS
jgi:hypothetical protein